LEGKPPGIPAFQDFTPDLYKKESLKESGRFFHGKLKI
jgi:hypothetical protein